MSSAPVTLAQRPEDMMGYDDDEMWVAAMGRTATRGQAKAYVAQEIGCDFTELSCRQCWLAPSPDYVPNRDVYNEETSSWTQVSKDFEGAVRFWHVRMKRWK